MNRRNRASRSWRTLVPFLCLWLASLGQAAGADAYRLIYFDGHMHTTHSDGSGSIADVAQVARARGLDAVIVTDHTPQIVNAQEWNEIVTECAALSDSDFLMIPSFEITGSEGYLLRDHFLAWGVYAPFVSGAADGTVPERFWPSPTNPAGTGPLYPENIRAWVDYVHANGGLAVHAHTWGTTQPVYNVDFIELFNFGTVKDIIGEVKAATGGAVSDELAYQLGLVMNNFAVYGDRDLHMPVDLPGVGQGPLRMALYAATGQWLGMPESMPLHSWDDQLLAYVHGQAAKPVFGVANSDAHNTANTDLTNTDPLYDTSDVGKAKNGVLVTQLDGQSLFDALRAGRFFATTGPSLTFEVNDALMGQTVEIGAGQNARIRLSGNAESDSSVFVKVDIIRNGEVFETLTPQTPTFDVMIEDENPVHGYYRAELTTMDVQTKTYQFAWANPVFVHVDDLSGWQSVQGN